LAAQGRWEQARARLVVLLEVGSGGRLEPLEHAHALQALAIALAGQGHHAAAQAMAEEALEVLAGFDPGSPARSEAEAVRARVLRGLAGSRGSPGAQRICSAGDLPLTRTGSRGSSTTSLCTARMVYWLTITSPALATLHSREAMFTGSPITVYCSVRDEPIAP